MKNVTQTQVAKELGVSVKAISKLVARGMPLSSVAAAKSWREVNCPRGHFLKSVKAERHSGKQVFMEGNDHYPQAVTAFKMAVQYASEDFDAARAADNTAAKLQALKVFSQAVRELAELEERHVKHLRDTGALISYDEAIQKFVPILQELRNLLESMPKALAPRCNPSDPELARAQMDDYIVNMIFKQISRNA